MNIDIGILPNYLSQTRNYENEKITVVSFLLLVSLLFSSFLLLAGSEAFFTDFSKLGLEAELVIFSLVFIK